ncbi:hypothetical protein [Pseudokordiimonas caeni]|nr:hypothetical protein [Pseudokordiimonas caeni]
MSRTHKSRLQKTREAGEKRQLLILGILVAVILIAVFAMAG